MTTQKPQLIYASDYPDRLIRSINQAKKHIFIVETTFRADDDKAKAIASALCDAKKRGVKISIGVDSFTYMEPDGFKLTILRQQSARVFQSFGLERQLIRAGINFKWLGRRTSFLMLGRTHAKWVVVDDEVYIFGGVNLDHESFNNVDYVFRLKDENLAKEVILEHKKILKAERIGGAFRSRSYKIDEKSTALFDGGFVANSIIYKRACTLAKTAKRIVFVSQYCPTGELSRIFRKKKTKMYFNHWRNASASNRLIISFGMVSSRHKTLYKRDKYLHGKLIIFEMENGEKVALSGSHNFMATSGLMGTREVAIETKDENYISQLEEFIEKHVAL